MAKFDDHRACFFSRTLFPLTFFRSKENGRANIAKFWKTKHALPVREMFALSKGCFKIVTVLPFRL
jgi:hypothetical protein